MKQSTNGKRTKREELQAYQDMTGEIEPELDFPQIPPELSHVVSIYNQLGSLNFGEIESYQSVYGVSLKRFEIDAMQAIETTKNKVFSGASLKDFEVY